MTEPGVIRCGPRGRDASAPLLLSWLPGSLEPAHSAGYPAPMLAGYDGFVRTYQMFSSSLRLGPLLAGGLRSEHGAEQVGGALVSCVDGMAVDV